jgi:Ser/Thr protein kinase RdoA (MazF antagonist)
MHKLHHSGKTSYGMRRFDGASLKQRWRSDLLQIPAADVKDLIIELGHKVVELAVSRLSSLLYLQGTCHEDLHQLNVLFNGEKALYIDLGGLHVGDPMQELAYYAYHVDLTTPDLADWNKLYPGASAQDIGRAQSHLAMMHAERYVQTLSGMPWDKPDNRAPKLARHRVWLAQDLKALTQH